MRIGINTLSVFPAQIGGGQTYLVNLLENTKNIDTENQYILFVNRYNQHLFSDSENTQKVLCPASKRDRLTRVAWEQFVLPLKTKTNKIDVLFCPANIAPAFGFHPKSVLTIHDLNWLHFGKHISATERTLLKWLVTKSAKTANKIIAVSKSTKADIISHLGIPQEKIKVVYEAAGNFSKHTKNPSKNELTNKLNINTSFILSVGTTHFHKNFLRLLEAYRMLKANNGFKHKLILAGMPGRAHTQILKKVRQLDLQQQIIIKGHTSDEDLKMLYRNAELFIMPSLYEGFGLPVLEAMACGTPVVSSNATSLPEIGGSAAIYFNPSDTNDMAEKIALVLKNRTLRSKLTENGFENIKRFSWEKTAKETLKVFEEVYNS